MVYEKNKDAMTQVNPYVLCDKNTHAMNLVVVYEKDTHAMIVVDPRGL